LRKCREAVFERARGAGHVRRQVREPRTTAS
jgi:hypothetical protein